MATSEFTKITQTERDNYGVKALSNRPNETGLYGVGGLTEQQLKEWFDKYANLLADRFNALCDIFHGENGADVAQYIKLPNFGSYENLRNVLTAIGNGTFANTLMAKASASAEEYSSLQSIINSMAATLSIVITTSNYTSYIVDALNSDDATKALSAKQGKALKSDVDLKIAIASIVDNLTTNDATKVLSAKQGKALKDLVDTLSSTSASSYGTTLDFSVDTSNYVLTVKLKNSSGTVLSTASVDLPLELLKVNASYANGVLTLNIKSSDNSVDNAPIEIDISDLISGLVNSADIADNLTTDDATKVLSAKQGKKLNDEKIDKTSIADDLVTDDDTKVLSAKQGKKLSDEKIDKTSIVDNLTSDDDTKVLSAKQGKALKTYTDGQVTAVNTKITDDRIRIANLENSVYNFILGKEIETFSALKSAVLPSGITIDETLYAIADGARGILADIKGNTKQFNQPVRNGNFSEGPEGKNYWQTGSSGSDTVFTVSNGVARCEFSANYRFIRQYIYDMKIGHKYLIVEEARALQGEMRIDIGTVQTVSSNTWQKYYSIITANNTTLEINPLRRGASEVTVIGECRNVMVFDLTTMGLDSITSVEEFTALYPKSYYPYNAGTLYNSVISGLALTGRNLLGLTATATYGTVTASFSDSVVTVTGNGQSPTVNTYWKNGFNFVLKAGTYYLSYSKVSGNGSANFSLVDYDTGSIIRFLAGSVTLERDTHVYIGIYTTEGSKNCLYNIQLEAGSTATPYEPYALRTINLPSAQTLGGVRTAQDEIQVTKNTNNDYYTIKKIQRVASVDLGIGTWQYDEASAIFKRIISGINPVRASAFVCTSYINSGNVSFANMPNMTGQVYTDDCIYLKNTNYIDPTVFKTSLSGVMLTYELATPVETTITTTATLAEVSAIRTNGGMISVQGNDDNEDYVQPDVDVRVTYKIPQTGGES